MVFVGFFHVAVVLVFLGLQGGFSAHKSYTYPQVEIKSGILRGSTGTSRDGKPYYQFLGIPYAQPPVGILRFESPQPAPKWEGIRWVDKSKTACLQLNIITGFLTGSEDCLYLNVYVPKAWTKAAPPIGGNSTDGGKKDLLPVMVYIYGGYFMYGSSYLYGPQYFMDEEIVLVTFNYRVGALGFLNTGDGVVRGNMGLKDQSMALKWVQENIVHFGGDPSRVTLFGESAGASSVHYHVLSKMSAGLFQRAISQSGSAVRTWQLVDNPGEQAKRLGKQLNCPTTNTENMVWCLKNINGNHIASLHKERLDILSNHLAQYAPTLETLVDDEAFLYRHPIEIIESGNFSHVPWICGVNSDEGLVYSARIVKNRNVSAQINSDWDSTAPVLLNYNAQRRNLAALIRQYYFSGKGSSAIDFRKDFQDLTDMFSDRLYFTAMHYSALAHAKYAPVYTYYYTHMGEFTFYNLFASKGKFPRIVELGYSVASNWVLQNFFRRRRPRRGVCHGDDVAMLFHMKFLSKIKSSEVDYQMSKGMVQTWVQFAYGSKKLQFLNHDWPPINRQDDSPWYMNLNGKTKGVIREPFTARVKFWKYIGVIS